MCAHLFVAVQLEIADFFGALIYEKVSSFVPQIKSTGVKISLFFGSLKKTPVRRKLNFFFLENTKLPAFRSPNTYFQLCVSNNELRFLSRPSISCQSEAHEEV